MTPKETAEKIASIVSERRAIDEEVCRAEEAYRDAVKNVDRALKARKSFYADTILPTEKEVELAREVVRLYAEAVSEPPPALDDSNPVSLVDSSKPFSVVNFRVSKSFTNKLFGTGCSWSSCFCPESCRYSMELRDRDSVMLVRITQTHQSVVLVTTFCDGVAIHGGDFGQVAVTSCREVQRALERIAERNKTKPVP